MDKKLTDDEKVAILGVKLKYEDNGMYMHCAHCIDAYNKGNLRGILSPREAMAYEGASQKFTYPNGEVANIMVLWCKKCKRLVWDSRHLTPIL